MTSLLPGVSTADRFAGLIAPFWPAMMDSVFNPTSGVIYGCRVIVPKTGILHDLAVYHGTSSGNHRAGIYDTGDSSAGNRSSLYDSGSVAMNGTAGVWQVLGDPSLRVVRGQHLDFVVTVDNATATIGRKSTTTSTQQALPTSFIPAAGGASPKTAWSYNPGSYAALPGTISEANCGTSSGVSLICIIARIV